MNLCNVNVTDGIISIIPYDHLRLDHWLVKVCLTMQLLH